VSKKNSTPSPNGRKAPVRDETAIQEPRQGGAQPLAITQGLRSSSALGQAVMGKPLSWPSPSQEYGPRCESLTLAIPSTCHAVVQYRFFQSAYCTGGYDSAPVYAKPLRTDPVQLRPPSFSFSQQTFLCEVSRQPYTSWKSSFYNTGMSTLNPVNQQCTMRSVVAFGTQAFEMLS
jgi:hypothetical protein